MRDVPEGKKATVNQMYYYNVAEEIDGLFREQSGSEGRSIITDGRLDSVINSNSQHCDV